MEITKARQKDRQVNREREAMNMQRLIQRTRKRETANEKKGKRNGASQRRRKNDIDTLKAHRAYHLLVKLEIHLIIDHACASAEFLAATGWKFSGVSRNGRVCEMVGGW